MLEFIVCIIVQGLSLGTSANRLEKCLPEIVYGKLRVLLGGRWMAYMILPGLFCEWSWDVTYKKLTKGNNFFLCVLFMDILNKCFPKSLFKILLATVNDCAILLYGYNYKMFVVVVLVFKPHGGICHLFYQENIFLFNGSRSSLIKCAVHCSF